MGDAKGLPSGRNGAQRRADRVAGADIHRYADRIMGAKARIAKSRFDVKTALDFLNMLALVGLSLGRQWFYASRITHVLEQIRIQGVTQIAKITKKECEAVLSEFVSRNYSGETKLAYAPCIQKLVNYAKTGTLGSKKDGYVKEISWIIPSQYRSKTSGVSKQDLLTPDEFHKLIQASNSIRNRAMLWVMYEGAFRPGELLNMRVGGVEFADRYVMVSTSGKTGTKSIALVHAFHALEEWMSVHPSTGDPTAPMWYSEHAKTADHSIGYGALCRIIKKAAAKAGIEKPVWAYLFRHTQITNLSTKLPDPLLRVYGNWSPGSRMAARYTHPSGRDAKSAILAMHGIAEEAPDKGGQSRRCPRCGQDNEPGTPCATGVDSC